MVTTRSQKNNRKINLLSTYGDKLMFTGLGFVICVLWFDLMFDTILLTSGADIAPILTYYQRVTTMYAMNWIIGAVALLLAFVVVVRNVEVWKAKDIRTEQESIQFGFHPLQLTQTALLLSTLSALFWIVPLANKVSTNPESVADVVGSLTTVFYAHAYYLVATIVALIIEYVVASSTAQLDDNGEWELIKRD
jgi:hypothetical protein